MTLVKFGGFEGGLAPRLSGDFPSPIRWRAACSSADGSTYPRSRTPASARRFSQVTLGTTAPDRVTAAAKGSDIPLTRSEWYALARTAGHHVP